MHKPYIKKEEHLNFTLENQNFTNIYPLNTRKVLALMGYATYLLRRFIHQPSYLFQGLPISVDN